MSNKSFMTRINVRQEPNIDIGKMVLAVAFELETKVDKFVIKKIYEAYKNTEVSRIYVLDETEFEEFLTKMLPRYMNERKPLLRLSEVPFFKEEEK